MPPVDPSVAYRQAAGIVTRTIVDETLLVPTLRNVADPSLVSLDAVGAFLWSRLKTPQTVRELAAALTEAYEVSADQARDDVTRYLEDLSALAAVEAHAG